MRTHRRAFLKSGMAFTGLIWVPKSLGQFVNGDLRNGEIKHAGAAAAAGGGGGTTFVTGQTLGTPQSAFDLELGCRITVGGSDITVTEIGRWVISGNSQSHALKIRNNSGTEIASATLNTSGLMAGQFHYVALSATLTAGQSYYILSVETAGGDENYSGNDTSVTHTAVATVDGYGYYNGSVNLGGSPDDCYVPMSFKYSSP